MDLDYKYKLVAKWLQEKQIDKSRLDLMFDLELENSKEFDVISDSTVTNKEMINILNFIFYEKKRRLEAELRGKDKIRITKKDKIPRRRNIKLWQLIEAGIIEDGTKVMFYHPFKRRRYKDEYAIIDFKASLYVGAYTDKSNNMLLYGETKGSPSDLAAELIRKHGIAKGKQETQGSIFWITENGETLDDINNKARRMGL